MILTARSPEFRRDDSAAMALPRAHGLAENQVQWDSTELNFEPDNGALMVQTEVKQFSQIQEVPCPSRVRALPSQRGVGSGGDAP